MKSFETAQMLKRLALALALIPSLGACSGMKVVEWSEDVRLSDGRTVVVARSNEYRQVADVGAGFQRGWNFERTMLQVRMPTPNGATIRWQGTLTPIVLGADSNGDPLLVGVASSSQAIFDWKLSPRGESHVALRFVRGEWERISLEEVPILYRKANLFISAYKLFLEHGVVSGIHVDPETKSRLDANPAIAGAYKEVRVPHATR